MSLPILIVDDEAAARGRMRRLLAEEDVDIVGEASDGLEALTAIVELQPAVVLLDVQMPGLDGFEVLRALPSDVPPPLVVIVTAYEKHALAAFDVEAVSYLLKPVDREQLAKAVARCRELIRSRSITDELARLERALERVRPQVRRLVARTQHGFRLVPIEAVLQAKTEGGLVVLQTNTERLRIDRSLGDLERDLPQPPFFRARRSAIVNLDHVREIEPYHRGTYALILDDAERTEVLVSERQSKKLREWLEGQGEGKLSEKS